MRTRRRQSDPRQVQLAVVPRKADGGLERRSYRYARLMQVSITNTYYAPPHACDDFTVSPTVASAALMKSLGLLLLAEPDGFSVLYDVNTRLNLLNYLSSQLKPFQVGLSFHLQLLTPEFGNFTRLPVDLDPASVNFYFTNQQAHVAGRRILLNRGRFVLGDELVEVVSSQVAVTVDETVVRVEVLDVFQDVVLCVPRCVPAAMAVSVMPDSITCEEALKDTGPRDLLVCRNTIYLQFASLTEGLYTIREVRIPGLPRVEHTVLYTGTFKYAFVNLLFCEPPVTTGEEPGVYPVRRLTSGRPAIVPVDYELAFRRRATYWRYYVVLPPKARGAGGLTIQTEPPGAVTFSGPTPVLIATATPAFLFVSDRPVPLSQTVPVRFILNSDDGVLMNSMPVASTDQILPNFCFHDYSDVYVYV